MTASIVALTFALLSAPYAPTWESLDQRPNPPWFEEAKFGIMVCWGVYAVPAWAPKDRYAEWYWHDMVRPVNPTQEFHNRVYGDDVTFQDLAAMWKAPLFDPAQWASLIRRSGAKYVVLTTKHHSGFCLWPSEQAWNWNSVDIGPHRDITGELTEAVRAEGLRMGLYYSLYEWFNPLYQKDVGAYVDQHMLPQLKDLVQRYKPDIVWPDGEWDHPSTTWRSTEFLAWLFNESDAPKDVAVNDRWGKECRNVHGGFATPEYGGIPDGVLIQRGLFEECQGMGMSFGYNRNEDVDSYRTATELIHLLIDNVSRGGNLLLDIGPTADGRIPVIMQQRLVDMGQWLDVNGEAIYGSEPWPDAPAAEYLRFTTVGDTLYAIALEWPTEPIEIPGAGGRTATLLGYDGPVESATDGATLRITPPAITPAITPCDHAWVFKLMK
jgi:alpha-L-fucosidase